MSVRTLTLTVFAILGVATAALYVLGRMRCLGLTSLGDVVDAARASTPARLVLALVWVWLGWHFLAR